MRWLADWLVGDVVKTGQDNASQKERETIAGYIRMVFRALLVISVVMGVFIAVTVVKWVSPDFLAIDLKLEGGTLAGYVGTALGTVVALAGSLVAIVLALRAQQTSEDTKALQGTANDLSRQANHLAQAGTPEYIKAFDAATSYSAFKADLVLLPLKLRRMQRDGELNDGVLTGLEQKNTELDSVKKGLVEKLFDSILIAVLPNLARRNKDENAQRLIEGLLIEVREEKHFMLAHRAAINLVNEIDDLVKELWEAIGKDGNGEIRSFEQYRGGATEGSRAMTLVEYWFVRLVHPYTEINKNLEFSETDQWLKQIRESFTGTESPNLPSYSPDEEFFKKALTFAANDLSDGEKTGPVPTIVGCYFDSGLYRLLMKINAELKSQDLTSSRIDERQPTKVDNKEVQIALISNEWARRLGEFLTLRKRDEQRKQVIILDQIDRARDGWNDLNTSQNSYFNFIEHLRFWRLCQVLDLILERLRSWEHTRNKHGGRTDREFEAGFDLDHRGIASEWLQGLRNIHQSSTDVTKKLDPEKWSEHLANTWGKAFLAGKKKEQFKAIFRSAANRHKFSKEASERVAEKLAILIDGALRCDILVDESNFKLHETLKTLSDDEKKVIAELALSPLFDRPIFAWNFRGDGYRDLSLPRDMKIFATVYRDSDLKIAKNEWIQWLMDSGGSRSLYWIH